MRPANCAALGACKRSARGMFRDSQAVCIKTACATASVPPRCRFLWSGSLAPRPMNDTDLLRPIDPIGTVQRSQEFHPPVRSRARNPQHPQLAGAACWLGLGDRVRLSRSLTLSRHEFSCITHRSEAARMQWRNRGAESSRVRRDTPRARLPVRPQSMMSAPETTPLGSRALMSTSAGRPWRRRPCLQRGCLPPGS